MTPTKETLRKGQPVKITWQGATVTAKYLEWSDKYNLAIVDYNGRRLHRNLKDDGAPTAVGSNGATAMAGQVEAPEPVESRFTVDQRFGFLEKFVSMVGTGKSFSLAVAGEGGLGKSHTVETVLKTRLGLVELGVDEDEDGETDREEGDSKPVSGDYRFIKGFTTPKAMYRALWENHDKIVIFDDCDAALETQASMNILKSALDSKPVRRISWLTELTKVDDDLPKTFEFTGGVIFITNHRLEDLPQAIISRALTVDVSMTADEKIERMRTIASKVSNGMTLPEKNEVIDHIAKFKDTIGDLNMRTFLKVCDLRKDDPADWRDAAEYMITAL